MTSEGDLARALNALSTTLNDQKAGEFNADRVQQIATGATGGVRMFVAYGSGTSGELREGSVDGETVARLELDRGGWSVERVPDVRKSKQLQEFEQQREQQKKTEHQKPVRGRAAIWKKSLSS